MLRTTKKRLHDAFKIMFHVEGTEIAEMIEKIRTQEENIWNVNR